MARTEPLSARTGTWLIASALRVLNTRTISPKRDRDRLSFKLALGESANFRHRLLAGELSLQLALATGGTRYRFRYQLLGILGVLV
jgi:hypothetical protein